ncbi:hypothetical protein [Celerinatantimonas sp. YJH-8]|uniref:hypothetical protein n=1 Tax=Celerinatantimonas sp. YJH-8 TaxID=3228714 RepID=UPI0038BFB570
MQQRGIRVESSGIGFCSGDIPASAALLPGYSGVWLDCVARMQQRGIWGCGIWCDKVLLG